MDNSLHYLIMANQMLVQKALLDKLKDTGLTIGQPKILDFLKEHDGSNQKEIAKACFLEAGSLTTILNGMEEKGLITRQILNGNKRSFHIFMTDKGKEKQQLISNAFSEIEKKAVLDISEEEYNSFMSVYEKIYKNLLFIAIFAYVLPHMIHSALTNQILQRGYRYPFLSGVYETVLSWYILLPTTVALIFPHKGKFNVTAKGGDHWRKVFGLAGFQTVFDFDRIEYAWFGNWFLQSFL